jgi:hypothetical protein
MCREKGRSRRVHLFLGCFLELAGGSGMESTFAGRVQQSAFEVVVALDAIPDTGPATVATPEATTPPHGG